MLPRSHASHTAARFAHLAQVKSRPKSVIHFLDGGPRVVRASIRSTVLSTPDSQEGRKLQASRPSLFIYACTHCRTAIARKRKHSIRSGMLRMTPSASAIILAGYRQRASATCVAERSRWPLEQRQIGNGYPVTPVVRRKCYPWFPVATGGTRATCGSRVVRADAHVRG